MSLVIRLAVADAALVRAPVPAPIPARPAPSVAAAEREGRLILLVDDHPTNRAVIARQLQQIGYASETAVDGEAGLQSWRSGRFALLLTDLHMPRCDGYALAEAVRVDERSGKQARKPIIAMSANVSTEEVERSRAAGIDDFIAKPAPLQLLATVLHRYLPIDIAPVPRAPDVAPAPAQPDSSGATPTVSLDSELLRDFLDSTRQDLAALEVALAQHDTIRVAREAHRIKGASGLVGAGGIVDCADRIERSARTQRIDGIAQVVAELGAELERFAAHALGG
jgi:CheY-like chemotaxis protein/HPt (histidine-containing phosphotransfer) domain-containing protein